MGVSALLSQRPEPPVGKTVLNAGVRAHVGAMAVLLLLSGTAAADAPQVQADARLLSAHTDTPTMALFWRGQLHAKVGVPIPLRDTRSD